MDSVSWPEGVRLLPFEDLEGAILVDATIVGRGGRDTSGVFVLDTGAGYLALDLALARLLGVADDLQVPPVALAPRALPRLDLGGLQLDQVSPVLTVDAGVVRRVTGRPVLGLLGQGLFRHRLVVVDYREEKLAILPAGSFAGESTGLRGVVLSPAAVGVPFELAGDGKMIVAVRVADGLGGPDRLLDLIVDTGATKTVFFRRPLDRVLPRWRTWPSLRGLGAPTLTGDAPADLVRVPRVIAGSGMRTVSCHGMDAAVIGGDLGAVLAKDVGRPVHGLLGYSFLKRFRTVLDFPRGMLWLDPSQGRVPDRPDEYSHPGLQLESIAGRVRIVAVAEGSPAARAGIQALDELLAIDGEEVTGADVVSSSRRLEGAPGTSLALRLKRGAREWSCRLVRRRLL